MLLRNPCNCGIAVEPSYPVKTSENPPNPGPTPSSPPSPPSEDVTCDTTHALLQPPAAVSTNMALTASLGVAAPWRLLSAVLTTLAAALMTIPSATLGRVLAMCLTEQEQPIER